MKKWYYFLIAFVLVAGSCKKDKGGEGGSDEETYECLPKRLDYVDHNDATENENTVYTYEKNRIKSKLRTFASGRSYTYNYYYTDPDKGLLERIDIVIDGDVVARVVYENQNDLITHRKLQVISVDGTQWFDAWDVSYTYDNNNKMVQIRIQDYDLWNDGANPTDETGVYTYTGDNMTNSKWYDTNDMQTLKEEFTYEYDQGKRVFDNVVTQTYPTTRVNNVTHVVHQVYLPSPSTEETFTTIQYNGKGFPTQFAVTDDRGNALNTQDVEYENCD